MKFKGKGRRNQRKGERFGAFGFSEDDEMELLAQGVMPWDDDAAVSQRNYAASQTYIRLGRIGGTEWGVLEQPLSLLPLRR